jgi:hypothetical protein
MADALAAYTTEQAKPEKEREGLRPIAQQYSVSFKTLQALLQQTVYVFIQRYKAETNYCRRTSNCCHPIDADIDAALYALSKRM